MFKWVRYLTTFELTHRSKDIEEVSKRHQQVSDEVCDELATFEKTIGFYRNKERESTK